MSNILDMWENSGDPDISEACTDNLCTSLLRLGVVSRQWNMHLEDITASFCMTVRAKRMMCGNEDSCYEN